MLQLRPNGECCNIVLPPDARNARICSFKPQGCAASA
ncbi:MAG: DUF1272 domain-containing protein [Hydrogenophaga sp.]|nr:DUF1272 domain-containing protein [Hydrogenophaga sp.]NIM40604.1 DUF1272 domain-containing protein [Hydrogenophaga sp.]NIN26079.1 DUF1272 domain-containing protein [Hydrogenophaga sp.]NIN30944.1 DUF1272 domain-containing protein [Hydrogenophaga sp.]NIN54987.1 DUF1272 domain-containing protein [Hydrogenophaga sp.]NIO51030.1 DUF1272 domain-containing protein [Hydrogenophaga sp.]